MPYLQGGQLLEQAVDAIASEKRLPYFPGCLPHSKAQVLLIETFDPTGHVDCCPERAHGNAERSLTQREYGERREKVGSPQQTIDPSPDQDRSQFPTSSRSRLSSTSAVKGVMATLSRTPRKTESTLARRRKRGTLRNVPRSRILKLRFRQY